MHINDSENIENLGRKLLSDAVRIVKRLDHIKLIVGPEVVRVVAVDKTVRFLSTKFLTLS